MEQAEGRILQSLSQNGLERNDVGAMEARVRNVLGRLFYDETRRRPMVLPVITVI
ncbi:MAG: hypothetical protein ACRDIB_11040 [Ardenticatenaceae bacterium]